MLNKNLELLAPAGKWDVLESVTAAGADAVYLGGKKFNMRILRTGFNFSDKELERATEFLHVQKKKIYITVNNLYYDYEIEELKEYLLFLNTLKVDAFIVQDMGIVEICKQLNIHVPLHASIQMGAANLPTAAYLEDKGFARVILSKNLNLQEIADIHNNSNLGIEVFAHGDLCVSHTGQCYMSRLLLGQSGNRGSCKKPCRWQYQLHCSGKNRDDSFKYYLANNDLCVYPYLAELARAGVTSFKIEGRMRNAEFLSPLISTYRIALDRLQENPQNYQTDSAEMDALISTRLRDYTPGHLFIRPSLESIGLTGEREPKFDTAPVKIECLQEGNYINYDNSSRIIRTKPELTVKVGNIDGLLRACRHDIDNVILPMEISRQDGSKWVPGLLDDAVDIAKANNIKIYLETPRVVTNSDWHIFKQYGMAQLQQVDGIIVNDYGHLHYLKNVLPGKEMWAGAGLNITNLMAASNTGVKRVVTPYELEAHNLASMIADDIELQLMVQGPICAMVTDLCLSASVNNKNGDCPGLCTRGEYALLDKYGQKYRLRSDMNCRNYLFYPHELCLLMQLPMLADMGIKSFQIEGQYYNPDLLEEIVAIYGEALDNIQKGMWQQHRNYQRMLQLIPQGLTDRPFVACSQ